MISTSLIGNSTSIPSLAYSYNFFPLTLTAEYLGTCCLIWPLNLSKALIISSLDKVNRTSVLILADKEEVGSMGNTGMESHAFEFFVSLLLDKTGEYDFNALDKVLYNSKMISADVTSALDPTYDYVDEKNNAAYLGKGIVLAKYTGSRGKSGSSEASAEFVAFIRNILEENRLLYQMSDMGKVDEGGGGTIAYILANKGMDVIDAGVCVLSMHSPYEVSSKFDIYNAYLFYSLFYKN